MTTDHDVTGDLSGTYLKKQDVEDRPLTLTIVSVDKVTFESPTADRPRTSGRSPSSRGSPREKCLE